MREEERTNKQTVTEWIIDREGLVVLRRIEIDSRKSDTK